MCCDADCDDVDGLDGDETAPPPCDVGEGDVSGRPTSGDAIMASGMVSKSLVL